MRFTVGTLCARLPVACTTIAFLLALGPFGAPDGILRAETRQVLAIRVEFQPDTLETTSGDGTFGSAFHFDTEWALDGLPHDRVYFEDHLTFLDHYFAAASGNRVRIEGEVWPRDGQAAYLLPKQMWQYNWNQSRGKTDEQLIELFRDAWAAADTDPELDFSRFDSFIVFHAGVGQDFGEDATPHDIPSAWVSPADLEEPVAVDDGLDGPVTVIDNGLLLPESENHENFQQGLAGTLVLQYAHVLGLPNLYNSQDGSSVIGKWGLMDQGSANYFGLVPALPSAFSRVLMGWEDPVVLDRDTTGVFITPAGMVGPHPRVYRIPLSEHEHLLLEYRLRDGDGDSLVLGTDRLGNTVRMDERYELTFPGDSTGVIVSVNDLDYDLPGSGVLVWHVDTRRTTPEYIQGNRVNDDPDPLNGYTFRGVDLEEGDGVQDIGQPYTILDSRRSVGLGSTRDPWYEGNRDWRRVNPDFTQVEYSWQGEPSSQTNDGRVSGVRLYGFNSRDAASNPDSLVFSLVWDFRPPVHGQALCPPADSVTVQLLELDDRATILCAIHPDGDLYSLVLGGPVQSRSRSNGFLSLLPPSGSGPFRGIWAGPADPSGWPELWALRGDVFHRYRVAGSAVPEALYEQVDVYDPFMPVDRAVAVHPGLPRIWFQSGGQLYRGDTDTGERTLVMEDLAADEPLAFGDRTGTEPLALRELLVDGTPLPAGARLQGLGQADRYLASDNSGFRIVEPGIQPWLQGYGSYRAIEWNTVVQVDVPNTGVWPIQAGGDSSLEVLVLDAAGGLRTWNSNGAELQHSPSVATGATRALTGSWNDGGTTGAVTLIGGGRLHRLDPDGTHDPDWPRVMPPFQGPLLASRRLGLYLGLGTDGRIVAWEGAPTDLLVSSTDGDASGMNTVETLGTSDGQPLAAQAGNPVYIWPNPTGDLASLRVTTDGAARVEMRVYDLAGDLRQTVTAQVTRSGITDIDWNTGSLSNGAYLCAVELTPAQGAASQTLIKCAVLK